MTLLGGGGEGRILVGGRCIAVDRVQLLQTNKQHIMLIIASFAYEIELRQRNEMDDFSTSTIDTALGLRL